MARENEPGSLQYDYCKYVPHSDAEKKPLDIGYKCLYCGDIFVTQLDIHPPQRLCPKRPLP